MSGKAPDQPIVAPTTVALATGESPVVSAVIAAHNAEKTLAEAIDSALNQEECQIELIVVDDGSTDSTPDIVAAYSDRIRTVRIENAGPAAARNLGVQMATGEWVAFLDSDDVWTCRKSIVQLQAAESVGASVVYCNAENFGSIDRIRQVRYRPEEMPSGDMFSALLSDNYVTLSGLLVRRSAIHAVGGFSEEIRSCEDWDLVLRLSEQFSFAVVTECLVRYRCGEASLSTNVSAMQEGRLAVLQHAFDSERGRGLGISARRKAVANSWAVAGWYRAAQSPRRAIRDYLMSFYNWPFAWQPLRGVLKGILNRG